LSAFREADTVSELLRSLHVRSTVFCLAQMHRPWGFAVPARDVASFHLVLAGGGILEVEDEAPVALETGDLAILPRGDAHVVRDEPSSPVTTIADLTPQSAETWELRGGGSGSRTELLCGGFVLEDAHPLVLSLPRILRVDGPVEWVDASVRLLRGELPVCAPGAEAVVTRVTDVLLAQAIRAHLLAQRDDGAPLTALGDPQIAAAVRLVHEEPERPWTVTELASKVALSRSAFSGRFRSLTGESPKRYVTRCRLARAAELLRETDMQLHEVARTCGYGSEVSLSRAFRRWFGTTPGGYRRRARAS
jgi:AraC-like DNA-binding protein/mannose-6-phosphate isomerase-like protein (cupin superfamily)